MSLNGDTIVMRGGRATSQVSIYNYPEHLNPFYDDDQHKRIRFWQISKHKDNGSRRGSFSLDGLKDIWAFKSFRSKKKSSTLGINKTSESPPPLRRDYYINATPSNGHNTIGSRYSTPDNFQRNAHYRSSLQNMNNMQDSPRGFGLNRNDGYRSTIQFAGRTPRQAPNKEAQQPQPSPRPVPHPRRYVYGGSNTPQLTRNTDFGRGDSLRPGLSRSSLSTNPFDSDDDDDERHFDNLSRNDSEMSLTSRGYRKKRRAPAPPVPIHGPDSAKKSSNDSATNTSQTNTELHIDESNEIANLTAEIESFVKTTTDTSSDMKEDQRTSGPRYLRESDSKSVVQSYNHYEREKTPDNANTTKPEPTVLKVLKYSPLTVMRKEFKISNTSTTSNGVTDPDLHIQEDEHSEEQKERRQWRPWKKSKSKPPQDPQAGQIECIHVHVESSRSTPEKEEPSRLTSFQQQKQDASNPTKSIETFETTTISIRETAPSASEKEAVRPPDRVSSKTSFTLANPPTPMPSAQSSKANTGTSNGEAEIAALRRLMPNSLRTHNLVPDEDEVTPRTRAEETALLDDQDEGGNKQKKIVTKITTETTIRTQGNAPKSPKTEHIVLEDSVSVQVQEVPRSPVKPPIAAKPTLEGNHFAVIHKPHNRMATVTFNEPKEPEAPVQGQSLQASSSASNGQSKGATPKIFSNQGNKVMNGSVPKGTKDNQHTEVDSSTKTNQQCTEFILHEKEASVKGETKPPQATEHNEPKSKDSFETPPVHKEIAQARVLPKVSQTQPLKIVESAENPAENKASSRVEEFNSTTTVTSIPFSAASSSTLCRTADTYFQEHESDFINLYRSKPTSHAEWKHSTLANLESNLPPERRRSVKDIIESINRSQRLLNASANKDFSSPNQANAASQPPSYTEVMSADASPYRSASRGNTPIAARRQIEPNNNLDKSQRNQTNSPSENQSNESAVGLGAADPQKVNNNEEIFAKGRVNKEIYDYRETSPTASNLDWNPVPKPKRSKNLSDLN